MTDFLSDSPCVARLYCPTCEPTADQTVEVLDVRWCSAHAPQARGQDDDSVLASAWLSGSTEAGGDDNRRWCQLFHRSASAAPKPAMPPAVSDALDAHAEKSLPPLRCPMSGIELEE